MAKKKNVLPEQAEEKPKPAGEQNYTFHSSAVDDLISAQKTGRAREYDPAELRKYRTHKGIVVKDWIKVILLKWWFAGVICYFMIWGLQNFVANALDQLLIVGISMGLVTDLLQNTLLSFMERKPHENDRWQMFPKTKIISILLNIVYAIVLVYLVRRVYILFDQADSGYTLGVEPILFGILYTAFDLIFISVKRTFIRIFQDAKSSVDRASGK